MTLTSYLQWGMRQSAEVANQLMAVERTLEYSKLPQEPNFSDKGIAVKKEKLSNRRQLQVELTEPPKNWPALGRLEFKKVFMHYCDDEPAVLKSLTMEIRPSEKVKNFISLIFTQFSVESRNL